MVPQLHARANFGGAGRDLLPFFSPPLVRGEVSAQLTEG